jgi:WD40 repeat protein
MSAETTARGLLEGAPMLRLRLHVVTLAVALAATAQQNGCQRHLAPAGEVALPGRGLALAWSPDGTSIAAGGHFRDPATSLRYDLRIVDVAGRRLAKSFACHYWWVIAAAWSDNPFLGEVVAEGGGDHAVKLWDAEGPGSTTCASRGQFLASEGALQQFGEIDGWTTSLQFSPDGRWLAGSSRDGAIRVWQIAPGPNQGRVVRLWWDAASGNVLSVRWSPDGRRLAAGDRNGRVVEWAFDGVWDDVSIALYAALDFTDQLGWFKKHAALVGRTPLWTATGMKDVWNVRYAPDGTRLAATGADGTLRIFAAVTGEELARLAPAKSSALHGLDWSPDGRWLAAGTASREILVYDARSGALVDTLVGHADVVTAVAWSPDGRTLASTAGGPLINQALNEQRDGPDMAVRVWTWRAPAPT